MTARILVLGSEDYDDPATVETLLEHTYLNLRPITEPPMLLLILNWDGAEQTAGMWWDSHGLQREPILDHGNPYVRLNSAISKYPDVVLLFGTSKFLDRAAQKARRHDLTIITIP